tara:strand:- start:701 stop:1873 length:1173 start_codon:yes stop_codon:yes gene_type:complete
MDGLNKSIYEIGSDTAFSILARSNELISLGKPVINLGIGQPDFPTPPNIIEAARKSLKDGYHGYTPSSGIKELREAVSNFYANSHRDIKIDPNQILITPGAKAVIFYTLLMFGQPGTEVIIPDPGFIAYKSMVDYTGATAVSLPHRMENEFSFDADELLSLITPRTKLIIFNSPGNPTGGVVPEKQFKKLVAGLARHPNVFVLSDEIYDRMIFGNKEHISLLSYPEIKEQVILLNGWSKTYSMTGWRLGYGIYPKSIYSYAEKLAINCHSCVNVVSQYAGIEALNGTQKYVNEMIQEFQKRKNFIVKKLNKIENIECVDPGGAFYVFPRVKKNGLSSKNISKYLLEDYNLATVPGSSFGQNGEEFLRISYASSMENLDKACKILTKFMND